MKITLYTDVRGYEGRYQVSSDGQVRSLLTNRVLKQMADKKGHLRVTLYGADRSKRTVRVHVLMLEAFVGPRPAGMEACHHDDIKSNNSLENLRWGTSSDNASDRVRNGLHNMARKTRCPQNHPYNEENTGMYKGSRYCMECRRQHARRYSAQKRARQ